MKIPKCNCSKVVPQPRKDDDGLNDFNSRPIVLKDNLCEDYTFVRGAGQRVIAFTYYEPPIQVRPCRKNELRNFNLECI